MLKLTVDWAGDVDSVPVGTDENSVRVEIAQEVGPAGGWPRLAVYAPDGPTLWSWLTNVYEVDSDEASWFADRADVV